MRVSTGVGTGAVDGRPVMAVAGRRCVLLVADVLCVANMDVVGPLMLRLAPSAGSGTELAVVGRR